MTRRNLHRAIPATVLALLIGYSILSMSFQTFRLPWYYMTEEFPYAQEVLRFLSFDFRQRFFDIPGTPLIAIVTAIFAPVLALTDAARHTSLFAAAFEHMQLLFLTMRAASLCAFASAVGLMYLTARQLVTVPAALIAAAIFSLHPIMALTLYHTRIEPFGLMLVLASIYLWLRAVETRHWWTACAAGLCAGLAMAARFPLLLTVLPAVIVCGIARPERLAPDLGSRLSRIGIALLGVVGIVGGALACARLLGTPRNQVTDVFFLSASGPGAAVRIIAKAWVAIGSIAALAALSMIFRPARVIMLPYADSVVAMFVAAFPVGFVVGVPTIFSGANFFLGAIQMFVERNVYTQDWSSSPLQVIDLYLFGRGGAPTLYNFGPVIPEVGVIYNAVMLLLFVCGVVAGLKNRWLHVAILVACAIGILSQFGKIQGTRHIAGWIPWFALVSAIGFDAIVGWSGRFGRAAAFGTAAVLGVSLIGWLLIDHYFTTRPEIGIQLRRVLPLQELQAWSDANVGKDELSFYACCDTATGDVILSWMKSNGVRSPSGAKNGVSIWFGDVSALIQAQTGYVILSRLTFQGAYLDYYRQTNPSALVDPYHDPAFRLVHSIKIDEYNGAFDILKFDMNKENAPSTTGITVLEASYGNNCSGKPVSAGQKNTARAGNVTGIVAHACRDRDTCVFDIRLGTVGDPAPNCSKDFAVAWSCPGGTRQAAAVPAEAMGQSVTLRCPAPAAN
jgi:hypothetical protein